MTLFDSSLEITHRLRRNRKTPAIRSLVQETRLHPNNFVAPLFILEGQQKRESIHSMPGIERLSIDLLIKEIIELYTLGIRAVDLFPVIPGQKKDAWGSEAFQKNNLLCQAVREIKKEVPEMCVMVDIALDPFTDHGHDGLVNERGEILNDATVDALMKMSLLTAEAGADVIAPSDMMDGRVKYLREALDKEGFESVSILSYAAKYASSFYGPFRDALHSAPKFGDKKTYQMNPANRREALLECTMDELEGADMLLIKPALSYLDVIVKVREQTHLPIAAYHVSGEYSMVMAAAQKGWIDGDKVMMECLMSIKRAGADFILTYAARQMAEQLSRHLG
jgi:porphobilinogen synthase